MADKFYDEQDIFPDDDPVSIPGVLFDRDGSALVNLIDDEDPSSPPEDLDLSLVPHTENLAEYLSETTLRQISSDLIHAFEVDLNSRSEWEDRYEKGIELLGINPEERQQPWPQSCGVYHPIMMESVVSFVSNAIMELAPAAGPAECTIIGEETEDKLRLAQRVKRELNYQITHVMTEFRAEMEAALFRLPISGSVFKKTYIDPLLGRQTSKMVPADDFIVQVGVSDIHTAPRFCHRDRIFPTDLRRLQKAGYYRDIKILSSTPISTKAEEAEDETIGIERGGPEDDRHTILEFHVDMDEYGLDVDGVVAPYIITIEQDSGHVLSIRRNWSELDPLRKKITYFTHYQYMPGFGVYGLGLPHLIGGPAEAATSLLRQLVDSGTLSNVPSGFKAKSFRVVGNSTPLAPGEFRDVDIPGGSIRDHLMPLDFKEPSQTLFLLLQNLIDEARRIVSTTDMKLPAGGSEAPVGTTLALLERSLRVMSAVHARLHHALSQELQIIFGLIRDYLPPQYEYDPELNYSRAEDFGGPIRVAPVSDPAATMQAQRLVLYQMVIQMAQNAPEVYSMPHLHRQALEVLGFPNADKIVKLPEEPVPTDPVSENMNILNGTPVKAFLEQDHEAHIQVHMALVQDPTIQAMVGQSANAAKIMGAMDEHIREHMAFAYRARIQQALGIPLPPPGVSLPPEIDRAVSQMAAEAASKVLQESQAMERAKQAQAAENDPLTQLQKEELAYKERDSQRDTMVEMERLRDRAVERAHKEKLKKMDLASQEIRHGAKLGVDLVKANKNDGQGSSGGRSSPRRKKERSD